MRYLRDSRRTEMATLSKRLNPKATKLSSLSPHCTASPFVILIHRHYRLRYWFIVITLVVFDKPLSVNCCRCIQRKALMIRIGSQQHSSCLTPVKFKGPCNWDSNWIVIGKCGEQLHMASEAQTTLASLMSQRSSHTVPHASLCPMNP